MLCYPLSFVKRNLVSSARYSEIDKQKNFRKTIEIVNQTGSPPAAKRLKNLEAAGSAPLKRSTPRALAAKSPAAAKLPAKDGRARPNSGRDASGVRKIVGLPAELLSPDRASGGEATTPLPNNKTPKGSLKSNLAKLTLARAFGPKAEPPPPSPKKGQDPGPNVPPGFGRPAPKTGKILVDITKPAPRPKSARSRWDAGLPAVQVTSAGPPPTSAGLQMVPGERTTLLAPPRPAGDDVPPADLATNGGDLAGKIPTPPEVDPRVAAEMRAAVDTLGSFLESLCRSKDSITKVTKVALEAGRTVGAAGVSSPKISFVWDQMIGRNRLLTCDGSDPSVCLVAAC
jgi:hypothetical protein